MTEQPESYDGGEQPALDSQAPAGLPTSADTEYELRYQIMDAHPMVGEHIARIEARNQELEQALLALWTLAMEESAGEWSNYSCWVCNASTNDETTPHTEDCIIPGIQGGDRGIT